ncbi:MAG: 3-deoxy-7-phosphoheptulonate synthase [Desulfobacterium sp.]|nr:3-deoxy-7-phosphoheptulonate synthase [Desulfobacterium sp.]
MKQTYDVNVASFEPLISPNALKQELPMTERDISTVESSRATIEKILRKEDKRMLVVTGPCSIHDDQAALEFAEGLRDLSRRVEDHLYLVMRVYFEKPRTTVGWKGLINDPCMDGSCDMSAGLKRARKLLLDITAMGVPTATEMLDPITPQYIAGLVSWAAIGARTTESQTHRAMASGLSMPVGFKNCTDGGLANACNAMVAAGSPQSFLGIDPDGRSSIIKTKGNSGAHIVLRGGVRPNYDCVSVGEAMAQLKSRDLPQAIVVDCSHANSRKKFQGQAMVWQDVLNQRLNGNDSLVGMMLESNLNEGSQACNVDPSQLKYGVSITDECISWETTEQLILLAHDQFKAGNVQA